MRVALRPAAERDIAEAMAWYDEQEAGLGDEFLARVDAAFERIIAHPTGYPFTHKTFRRALLGRFPYAVYFREETELLVVFAVYHQRRDPKLLEQRLKQDQGRE